MKKFLLKILLFLIIMAAVDCVARLAIPLFAGMERSSLGKVNYLTDKYDEDVLILGSSRATHHYDSSILQDTLDMTVYNGGFDANGIILAYPLYEIVAERHKPKLVVYEVFPQFDYFENDNVQYLQNLKTVFGKPRARDMFARVSLPEFIKMHSGLYALNSFTVKVLDDREINDKNSHLGFYPLVAEMNEYANAHYTEMPEIKPVSTDGAPDSIKINVFRDFIRRVKSDGTPLILTVSPVYDANFHGDLDSLFEIARQEKVPVIDHYYDSRFRGNDRYFDDGNHLNHIGAEKYSRIVSREIRDSLDSRYSLNQ